MKIGISTSLREEPDQKSSHPNGKRGEKSQ